MRNIVSRIALILVLTACWAGAAPVQSNDVYYAVGGPQWDITVAAKSTDVLRFYTFGHEGDTNWYSIAGTAPILKIGTNSVPESNTAAGYTTVSGSALTNNAQFTLTTTTLTNLREHVYSSLWITNASTRIRFGWGYVTVQTTTEW